MNGKKNVKEMEATDTSISMIQNMTKVFTLTIVRPARRMSDRSQY